MSKFQTDLPDFEGMSKEQLIVILDRLRESLAGCEDAGGFCQYVGEKLGVNTEVDAYSEDA